MHVKLFLRTYGQDFDPPTRDRLAMCLRERALAAAANGTPRPSLCLPRVAPGGRTLDASNRVRARGVCVLIAQSVDGVPIRLTAERWEHICRRHPDMRDQRDRVLETVGAPAELLEGDFGAKLATRFYRHTPLTSKHLVVAYKQLGPMDEFVMTAYFARRLPAWRRRLWKQ